PNEEARASSLRVFKVVRLGLSFFLATVSVTIMSIAVGLPLDISRIIGMGLAGLFLVLGNVLGKVRPNYFLGVRTPWTLESPEVWQKTHRLAGKIMVLGALLLLLGAILLPREASVLFPLPVVLVMALVPVIYSYF